MLRLRTFGGLAIENDGTPLGGAATQRSRLALLAILAVAGDRGLSRDKLMGYLWPESDAEHARNALKQASHALRRDLHADALLLGTSELRLNPEVIGSDVGEFGQALEAKAYERAVALYRGPFLDGVYLREVPEFERWLTAERTRLAERFASALETLAERAGADGEHRQAVEWWQRLAAVDPLSARTAVGLMRALFAAGNRAGALQHARVYESVLRQELETGPDPAVQALVAELRSASESSRPSALDVPRPDIAAVPPRSIAPPAVAGPAAIGAAPASPPSSGPAVGRGSPWRVSRVGVAALLVSLVIAGLWIRRADSTDGRVVSYDGNRVAIFPFRVIGRDSSLAYLQDGMVDLLAARLTGEGGPVAIDPGATVTAWRRAVGSGDAGLTEAAARELARELGAGQFVIGEVVATEADQVMLGGRMISSLDGRAGTRASVVGPKDSLFPLVDRLGARLLAMGAGEDHQRLASLTSRSPQALRAFLEGRAEHRRGHDAVAPRHFARALEHDSTFALAALELALARGWVFRWATLAADSVIRTRGVSLGGGSGSGGRDEDEWDRALDIAWRGREQLSPRDRALLLAVRGEQYPRPSDARGMLVSWERAVRAAPDRADAHYWLGQVLLRQGLAIGLPDSRARAAASFRRAIEIDSAFVSPLAGLIEVAAFERDSASLRLLGARYLARDSVGTAADYVRWRVAGVVGDAPTLRAVRARFQSFDAGTLGRIAWVSQVDGVALEDAERAVAAMVARASDRQGRQVAFQSAIWLALNRGRPTQAVRILAAKREVDPGPDLQHGHAIRHALMWDGDSAAAERAVHAFEAGLARPAAAADRRVDADSRRRGYWRFSLALRRLWNGDTTGAAQAIALAPAAATPSPEAQAQLLNALLAAALNRQDAAATLATVDSIALRGCCTLPHFINLVSARLHERTGNVAGALEAIRRGRWLFPPEYLSTSLREEGRLAALIGDREGAIRAYRHYLALRSNHEPSVRAQVERVRGELARLERGR